MKVVQELGAARCIEAKPANPEKELEWSSWRREFIGCEGWLYLCVSEKKYPGQQFLYFRGGSEEDWKLKTSYGRMEKEANQITFITRNSQYEFKILNDLKE